MKQILCPSCGAASYREESFKGDNRCTKCLSNSLQKLSRRELRMLAKDHGIVGYRWLGKGALLRYLTGRQPWYGITLVKKIDKCAWLWNLRLPFTNRDINKKKIDNYNDHRTKHVHSIQKRELKPKVASENKKIISTIVGTPGTLNKPSIMELLIPTSDKGGNTKERAKIAIGTFGRRHPDKKMDATVTATNEGMVFSVGVPVQNSLEANELGRELIDILKYNGFTITKFNRS